VAACACGRFQVVVDGDPQFVYRCHCDYCQKQSGSQYQAVAAFGADQIISITGDTKAYDGLDVDGVGAAGPGGTELRVIRYFCPTCGATVYYTAEELDDNIRVGVGCFVDPAFPQATVEINTALRHHTVPPVPDAAQFENFPYD
jgi:hypothetical protein